MKLKKRILLILFSFCLINFCFTSSISKSTQFSFLSFIKTAYDAYNKVKNFTDPDPDLADLINQAKEAPSDTVLNLIKDNGLELAGTIPEDNMVYEYDLNGRPTIELPEDNKSVKAAFEIFEKIIK